MSTDHALNLANRHNHRHHHSPSHPPRHDKLLSPNPPPPSTHHPRPNAPSPPRSPPPEQVSYMKHVRERNLVVAWEEAQRYQSRKGKGKGKGKGKERARAGSLRAGNDIPASPYSYFDVDDNDDDETDLGSVKSYEMMRPSPSRFKGQQFLAPPLAPWMRRPRSHSPNTKSIACSSVYSTDAESVKSKTPSIVEEWESEHGGFSAKFGMKQPATQGQWI